MSQQVNSDIEKAINTLNAQWRNYLAEVFNIDPSGPFQAAQGALVLSATDSSALFEMSDAVPAPSAMGYYDPNTTNKRSSAYGGLLMSLLPEEASDLQTLLGDQYVDWINFRRTYFQQNPTSDKTQEQVFEIFANQQLDPLKAKQAITAFKKAELQPLNQAIDAFLNPNNQQAFIQPGGSASYKLYRYTATNKGAQNAINSGKSIDNFAFDSSTQESTLKHTFAKGAASGWYDIFSGGVGGSYDQLNTKAAKAHITVNGKVGSVATLTTAPIGWYNSGEVNRAFNNKDNMEVWDRQASQGWNDFFAQPHGSLARHITQFVLVSDYTLDIAIHASFSQEDYQKITTNASVGIWPFFSASAQTTHTTDAKLNKDGSLSYTMSLKKGLIEIWGVTTQDAP